jgi:hypothetical protein
MLAVNALTTGELVLDEASTFFVAIRPLRDVVTLPITFHSQPPLYYLALHEWLRLGDTEPWLRLLSLLFMLGAAATLLSASWLSAPARVVTLGILLLSNYGLFLSGFIRPYALVAWLALWSCLLFCHLLIVRDRSARAYAVFTVVTLLMAYSLSMGTWLLLSEGVCLLAAIGAAWRRGGVDEARRRYGGLAVALAIVGVVYLPYAVAVWRLQGHLGHTSVAASLRAALNPRYYVSGPLYLLAMPLRLGFVAAAFAAYAAWIGLRRRDAVVGVLLVIVAVQIALTHGFLEGRSPFAFRYLAPAYPALCLLAGIGAAHWLATTRRASLIVAACAACALAATAVAVARAPRQPPEGAWRQVRRDLSSFPGPKFVFFEVGWDAQRLQYEARHDSAVRVMTNPGPGWAIGGDAMTPEYVSGVIAREARAPAMFFYQMDPLARRAAFDAAFVPAMERRGCARVYERVVPTYERDVQGSGGGAMIYGYACNGG